MVNKRVLRTAEAASYIGLSASTLEKLRAGGDGPRFIRLGHRAVGYDISDLDAWLDKRRDNNDANESTASTTQG